MPERNLNSSQIAAYIDNLMKERQIESRLPLRSRPLGRKRYLERRIEDIRAEEGIPIVESEGSRRGVIEAPNIQRILEVLISEAEQGESGRAQNFREVGLTREVIERAAAKWKE